MNTLSRAKKALSGVSSVEISTIPDDATLHTYLDSAAALEFLLALEEEFKIVLPDDTTTQATTLPEVVTIIDQLVQLAEQQQGQKQRA